MDKVSRALLAIAIAVLFPVLIYFTANTFLPDKKTSTRCNDTPSHYIDDYNYSRNLSYDCPTPTHDEERGVMRAGLAISLALIGLVGALGLRRIHELLVGLTVGGAVAIFGAVTYLSVVDSTAGEPVYQFVFWMAVFAFIALVSILYTADHSLPKPVVVSKPPKTQ